MPICFAKADMFGAVSEDNIAMLKLSKALAIAEVAINQGIAVSEAIRTAWKDKTNVSIWQAVAKTAIAIASVTTTMVSAIKSINSAEAQIAEAESSKTTGTVTVKGYSTGGLVKGEGTGTSDSIPARLSAGEFVIPAKTYKMFSPVLNNIYRAGQNWNVANRMYSPTSSQEIIPVTKEALSQSISDVLLTGIKNLDIKPTVSVVDINKQQANVDVIQSRNRRFPKK